MRLKRNIFGIFAMVCIVSLSACGNQSEGLKTDNKDSVVMHQKAK